MVVYKRLPPFPFQVLVEYVGGGDLSLHLRSGGLPLEQLREYTQQLVEALAYLHGKAVVHKDLRVSVSRYDFAVFKKQSRKRLLCVRSFIKVSLMKSVLNVLFTYYLNDICPLRSTINFKGFLTQSFLPWFTADKLSS